MKTRHVLSSSRANARPTTLPPPISPSLLDPLESRTLLTALAYQEFPSYLDLNSPIEVLRPYGDQNSVHTIGTSVAGIGDADGDGKADLVVGAAGLANSESNGPRSLAAVYSGGTGKLLYTVTDNFREFGASVAGIGDVNDDGVPDFMVGSPRYNSEGRNNPAFHRGAAYIYSGKDGALLRSFIHESAGMAPMGSSFGGDRFGDSVALAGDVNGDGVADVIIGAPGVDGAGIDRGRAYVYSGKDGALLASFDGPTDGYRLGSSVASAGDANNDGKADLLVGAPGSPTGWLKVPGHVYVFSGADSTVLFSFAGTTERDLFGFSVAAAGDVNKDATPDFIIGAPGRRSGDAMGDDSADTSDDADCKHLFSRHSPYGGAAFVYSGKDGSPLLSFAGAGSHDNLGASVAGAGDANGDGYADVIIGAPSANPDGSATIYSGKDGSVLAAYGGRSTALVDSDRLGTSVALVDDVNGDGFADFAFGATQDAAFLRNDRGRVYVFSGAAAANFLPTGLNDDADIWGTTGTGDNARSFLVLNGSLGTLTSRPGFLAGDAVIDVNMSDTVLGADKDGAPFIWKAGTRTLLKDLITTFDGPAGTFDGLRAVDLADSGDVLVERIRDTTTPTVWVVFVDTAKYRFDGVPIATNEAGDIAALNPAADPAASIYWTIAAGTTGIPDFVAAGMNEDGMIVGTKPDDANPGSTLASTWKAGTFTELGTITGGKNYKPAAINDAGQVVGAYTTADGKVSGFFYSAADGIGDIKPLVKSGGTDRFFHSTDMGLPDINNHSLIVGALHDVNVGFILKTFTGGGGGSSDHDHDVASARDTDGDLHVISIDATGHLIVQTKDAATGTWSRQDLTSLLGAPPVLSVVAWTDAASGNATFVASSRQGLLFFTQAAGNTWTMRNLTTEIAGSTPIVHGLVQFTDRAGVVFIAGLDTNGDVVVYRQTTTTDAQGVRKWEYENLSSSHLRPLGLATPIFTDRLIAYVTPWNGLNIAGLDSDGDLQVVWTSPGMSHWVVNDLTTLTGGAPRTGGLSVHLTPWGGINLTGVDRAGNTVVTWWVPAFGSVWLNDDLTAITGGPQLRSESLTAYSTPWGALNIAGLDRSGVLVVYWWTPGMKAWISSPIDVGALDNHSTDFRTAPSQRLSSSASADGTTNIFWTDSFGGISRLHWRPSMAWWHVEDVG